MKKSVKIGLILVVLAVASAAVYRVMTKEQPVMAPEVNQVLVETGTPETGSLSVTSSYIGKVEPFESVMVTPKMSGKITDIRVQAGDVVHKGDILYTIDDEDVQLQYAVAEAGYNSAVAQANAQLSGSMDMNRVQLEANLRSAKSAYDQAKDAFDSYSDGHSTSTAYERKQMNEKQEILNDAEDLVRDLKQQWEAAADGSKEKVALYEQYTAAQDARDDAKEDYENARAVYLMSANDATYTQLEIAKDQAYNAYQAARDAFEINDSQVTPESQAAIEAGLASAEAQLNQAKSALDYTIVTAPIDGVIEQRLVDKNDMTSPSSPAFVISNKNAMNVTFSVPANAVPYLEIGDSVTVESAGATYEATITEVSTMVDAQSGLFQVKAAMSADGAVLSGTSVKVIATTQKTDNALILPLDAVYYDNNQPYVYLYQDGVTVKREIQTGVASTDEVEIVSGVSAGDKVILTWHPSLTDGAVVTEANGGAAASSAPEAGPQSPAGEEEPSGGETGYSDSAAAEK